MNAILDGAQKRADKFFRDIAAVKKHADKSASLVDTGWPRAIGC